MPQFGDLVILASPRGKRHIYRLDPHQDIHTQDGVMRAADIAAARAKDERQHFMFMRILLIFI